MAYVSTELRKLFHTNALGWGKKANKSEDPLRYRDDGSWNPPEINVTMDDTITIERHSIGAPDPDIDIPGSSRNSFASKTPSNHSFGFARRLKKPTPTTGRRLAS
jgi:hypothetical protein